jgi:hypothetical protein
MEVLWAVAGRCKEFVLEANFRPRSAYERQRLYGLAGRFVEVFCDCPPVVAASRFEDRASSPGHHSAHVGRQMSVADLGEFDVPLAMGPVIRVDTTRPVDIPAMAQRIGLTFAESE